MKWNSVALLFHCFVDKFVTLHVLYYTPEVQRVMWHLLHLAALVPLQVVDHTTHHFKKHDGIIFVVEDWDILQYARARTLLSSRYEFTIGSPLIFSWFVWTTSLQDRSLIFSKVCNEQPTCKCYVEMHGVRCLSPVVRTCAFCFLSAPERLKLPSTLWRRIYGTQTSLKWLLPANGVPTRKRGRVSWPFLISRTEWFPCYALNLHQYRRRSSLRRKIARQGADGTK